jgi:hypothetical protein
VLDAAAPDLHIMVVAGVVLSDHVRLATVAGHVCFSRAFRFRFQGGWPHKRAVYRFACMHVLATPRQGECEAPQLW